MKCYAFESVVKKYFCGKTYLIFLIRIAGIVDPVTQQKQIVCLNNEGTCKRSICECDKALADDLSDLEVSNLEIFTNRFFVSQILKLLNSV